MKLAKLKKFLGKRVQLVWLDPRECRSDINTALKGQKALAKWVEYGVLDDLTEGVARLRHGEGYSPTETGVMPEKPDEAMFGYVQAILITDIAELK